MRFSIIALFLLMSFSGFAQIEEGHYRLKTQFRGSGECLEGNKMDGSKGGTAFMDKCQNVSGQLWKFERVR